MFDWLRNLGKSAEEKRQEALTAYLDNALTAAQRQAFEQELAQDAGLRDMMEQQRRLKVQLRRLPRMAAPRHFTLDPAVYGQQRPATTMGSYTILRTATVLAAFFFVLALVVDFSFTGNQTPMVAMEEAAPAAEQASGGVVAESVEGEAVEEEAAEEEEAEEPMEEMAVAEPTEEVEEAMPETAEDVAQEGAEDADNATAAYVAPLTSTPEPMPTVTGADSQEEQPGMFASEGTEAAEPAPSAGGAGLPRPTALPTLTGREAEVTMQPPALESDTANTAAATPVPTLRALDGPGQPVSTFRLVEFALGGIFLVLLVLTLLVRRRA